MERSRLVQTLCAAAAVAAGAAAAPGYAGHLRTPNASTVRAAPPSAGAPAGCAAPRNDEIGLDSDTAALGTNATDSARADFDRKAAALDLAARERVARRADALAVAVPQSLVESLLASCRYREWAQPRSVMNLAAFSGGTKRWRSGAELRFFVYVGLAEAAVEARGVGDPALVARLYAPIELEIPLSSVRGAYHPMRWPAS